MSYTTFLIGNGLGMAMDSDYFSLENAVQKVWSSGALDDPIKDRICNLCPDKQPPLTEESLEKLQRTLWSCKNLKDNENHIKWLTDDARNFPEAFDHFKHITAKYFFEFYIKSSESSEFKEFIDWMCSYVKTNLTHVLTLNYDSLLYNEFIKDGEIFKGYDGKLIDGLTSAGFKKTSLIRQPGKNFGYYLHLHGTPIVYDENIGGWSKTKICKKNYNTSMNKWDLSGEISKHIVLTHENFKSDIIHSSELLSAYWEYFENVLTETGRLILFGYSGNDQHVNDAIGKFLPKTSEILIVQWGGSTCKKTLWESKLENKVTLAEFDNILKWRT